jgi:hypothetical protein
MNRKLNIIAGLCALALSALCATPATGQSSEVKEKPPMYAYIANWQVPRAHWADMAKGLQATNPILQKAMADGTIIGYGDDENVVHEADNWTHDDWWNATSMAGILKMLDQLAASGGSSSPALESATKHWDEIFISRYYNWHSGSYKNGYVRVASYKLKKDAPDDAIETIAKNLVVPILEKELAAGTIVEYEIDEQFIHTSAPGSFSIVWVCPNAEAVDQAYAAVQSAIKAQPLGGPAFSSMVDFSAHRDELTRGNGTFK